MESIELILEEWNMLDLLPVFIENEIDVEALFSLTEDMIKELIPKVGPRAKFINKLNNHKLINQQLNHIDQEVYYIPACNKCIAKGKLIDRYRNKRRALRNCGLLPKKPKLDETPISTEFQSGSVSDEDHDGHQAACKNALSRVTDWDEILDLWEKSFGLRCKDYKALKSLEDIIQHWPPLKQPLGYKLIDFDYKHLFPESSTIFMEWDDFEQKIFRSIKESVKDETAKEIIHTYESPETNAESKAFALLLLLPYACKPSVIRLKNKRTWKPTCVESQESFVYYVKIMGDVEKAIEERKKRALKYGLTIQPFVLVVGQITNITACFVYINGIKYKIENVLHAIDICFKSFFVFDVEFPMESRQLWSLLQQSVYKLKDSKTLATLSQVAAILSN